MAKHIKMVLYGEPGVGKSTFAAGAPKPFFITTDGNYEYLMDFNGLDENDHIQCFSWAEMKKAFKRNFDDYETIVVDLLEDSYLWADAEFCRDNRLQHISDMGYGKGYGILGNDFFIEYQKLLALPKNIILIMHGRSEILKNRRGMEYTKFSPSNLVRDKIISQIEGRVRFFLRCYAEVVEGADGSLTTKRYLSLCPDGTTEYGITRGLSPDVPKHIPLDWDTFMQVIGNTGEYEKSKPTKIPDLTVPTATVVESGVADTESESEVEETKTTSTVVPKRTRKTVKKPNETVAEVAEEDKISDIREKLASVTGKTAEPVKENVAEVTEAPVAETPKTIAVADETPTETPVGQVSMADKMAAIKAKMAALKASKR